MADDLDDDEKALLEKHRAEKKKASAAKDEDKRALLWHSDGSGAEVPYPKAKKWLQDKFGIDLDEEPVQDADATDDAADDDAAGKPVRFGRRVG